MTTNIKDYIAANHGVLAHLSELDYSALQGMLNGGDYPGEVLKIAISWDEQYYHELYAELEDACRFEADH